MDAYTVIAKNHPWSGSFDEASFRARLYEDALWSQEEYWKVEWALCQLVTTAGEDAEVRSRVFRLFSATTNLFAAHFNPNDVFSIRNLDSNDICEIIERFHLVFEGFFSGEMPDLAESFDERNPLLSAGS
ncbi:Imm41 family immunity protein [Lysobacter sp. TAF61]|uniref:Imm41 family immunity protein n=1 Tax=Lysobacter sp. TAF61 TaxID=3233072 RepID=UPI003F9DF404